MEKEIIVNLKDNIVNFYQHLFTLTPKYREVILHSGRACTKSTFFCILTLCRLMVIPHADVMVLGYEFSSMRKKVFSDFKKAAFEILHLNLNELEFHETATGELWIIVKMIDPTTGKLVKNKIWFEHVKQGAEGLKGTRPSAGNSWIELRFYELTNFLDWNAEQIESTISTFIRNSYSKIEWNKVKEFCDINGLVYPGEDEEWLYKQTWYYKEWEKFTESKFVVTYEFNTPGSGDGGSWVMDWLVTKRKEDGVYYQFNTWKDMTEYEQFKFLGPITIKKIKSLAKNDPVTYLHEYEGKLPYDGDLVFPNININTHLGKFENFNPDLLVIGIDVGRSDATVCTLSGFEFREKDLRVAFGMHNWYHSNRKAEFTKDDIRQPFHTCELMQYANMIIEFCNMVHEEYPHKYIYLQMDYANEGKAFYDICFKYGQKPSWLNINRSWEKQLSENRIDLVNLLLLIPGVCKFYTRGTFDAYKHQIYGKMGPNGERKRLDDPSRPLLDMDRQDANEYTLLKEVYPIFTHMIKENEGKYQN